MPGNVFAQSDYDTSVTFTALAGSDSYANEGWENLFDGKKTSDDGTKLCCSFYDTRYVIFEASKAGKPVGYTITTGDDNSQNHGRNPLSWKLYGNNEGTSGEWTLIQEVTNDTQLQDVNYTSYDYTITGVDASYKYFMWEISAVHSGKTLQVGEFELKLVTCSHTNESGASALTEVSKTPATCTRRAYTTYNCSICKLNVEVEEGELAPHTLTHHEAKEATCTETGNIEYWQCSVCNKTFSDSNAETEVVDITIAAKGHSYGSNFVCTDCGYEDPRYKLMPTCDGLTFVKFVDNDYPWQVMDLNAEGMKNIGLTIPADSKGIMSTNYHKNSTVSTLEITLVADKNMMLSFDYAVSSEQTDYLRVNLDGKTNLSFSDKKQGHGSVVLNSGQHTLTFAYKKDSSVDRYADRAFIYNIKAITEFTSYVAVDDGNNTVTLRKVTNEDSDVNNCVSISDGAILKDFINISTKTIIIDESFKDYEPTTLQNFFSHLTSLTTISGLENINTSKVTDMSYMFSTCRNLQTLDIEKLNTSNVTNMRGMFYECDYLTSLDLSNFDTSNVTSMGSMFNDCPRLVSIKFGENFNTSNVTEMNFMFFESRNLKKVNIEQLNTSNVTTMYCMFSGCYALETLDLSGFNTRKVTNMDNMFQNCTNLKSIKFGENFDTSNLTSMYYMFDNSYSLETLDLTSFNTSKVFLMDNMFRMAGQPSQLKHIYVSDKFIIKNVNRSEDMFTGCTNLRNYDASSVDKTHANYGPDGYLEACYKIGDEYTSLTGDELKTTTLELKDGSDFMASAPFTAETATYSRTIAGGTRWNTLCLPFEVSLEGQNFRAFKLLSASDDVVELEEIETSIAAGQPVLIKMNEGATALDITAQDKSIATKVDEGSSTDNGGLQLVGLYTKKMFSKDTDNDCYIVKADKLMNPAKILENTSTKTVGSKGFRAYMKEVAQPSQQARAYRLSTDRQETAIGMLEDSADVPAEYYDLQGHKLSGPQKGVNILKRGDKTMKVIIR